VRVSSVLLAVVALILVISLLCIWFYPSAQDFVASNNMWNGIKNFSSEFSAGNIDSLDDLPDLPQETALVAIPYLEYTAKEMSKIKQFIEDGGVLLLMDDYGYGNTVLAYLSVDVRFTNKPLLDPLFSHKNQRLPVITNFSAEVKESGVNTVALNHATTLTNATPQEAIAWSSNSSFLDINENGSWEQDEPMGPFVVAAELRLGQGMVTVASDPSIMIDSMVDRNDNDSFIKYLTSHRGEQKSILVDSSHLPMAPLDISKTRLISTREALSSPYALLGITAMIFAVVSRYTLRKGGIIG